MAVSEYYGNAILNQMLKGVDLPASTGVYVGLLKVGGVEVSGGDYARILVPGSYFGTVGELLPKYVMMVNEFVGTIEWANVSWSGTITKCAIWDAATDGNMLMSQNFSDHSSTVAVGDTVRLGSPEIGGHIMFQF